MTQLKKLEKKNIVSLNFILKKSDKYIDNCPMIPLFVNPPS